MLSRLRARKEWKFFAALPHAAPGMAVAWWTLLVLRGVLPVVFGIGMGLLVGAVQRGSDLRAALAVAGGSFVLLQVLTPIHQAVSANIGDRLAAWLYDQLTDASIRPPGIAHLEDPALAADLTVARDFDLGMTGPPLAISMDFISGGVVSLVTGLASASVLFAYAWWAPLALGFGWGATHYLLRESGVWQDRNTPEVRSAQRHADYDYRLAVDAPAAKEVRLFGLGGWILDRFLEQRTRLHDLQYEATRLRERSVASSLVIVLAANALVMWLLADSAIAGTIAVGTAIIFAQSAVGSSALAFGAFNWALDYAASPVEAVLKLGPVMQTKGALAVGSRTADSVPSREIKFHQVTFAYPNSAPVLDNFDLTIPAGSSIAIVGANGAGKTTLAKLLCRFYDPQSGSIEADGVDIRSFDVADWRRRLTAVFQDFIRLELPLRDNVAPAGAPDAVVRTALDAAGASQLAELGTILARGYSGGTELSGGQWQRIALARALASVSAGAGVVLLDEPTAQLDVRGEAEIFDRILAATRHCTTILISHRFSTVRHADRICVLEHGRVVELGTHDELMARGGRYKTMFELQAERFLAPEDEGGMVYDVL
jgi:ABC-type multidrug transport system fused ATPase/permease subunit